MPVYKILRSIYWCLPLLVCLGACKKLIEIDPPIDTMTTSEVFSNNQQAEWAVAAMYSKMINGAGQRSIAGDAGLRNFANGLSTIQGGLSADELQTGSQIMGPASWSFQNKLSLINSGYSSAIWSTAYRIVYDASAVIEGIESSTSPLLTDSVRKQLTGEALALRAFSYFYLVNFFGDLPLVLTTDFNKTVALSRSPVSEIYQQIKEDLVKAASLLRPDYEHAGKERVRVSKWFAEALLARVYLYNGEYAKAISSANEVIAQSGFFNIEDNLSAVFSKTSHEAILQLKHTTEVPQWKTTTPEGFLMNFPTDAVPRFVISERLLNSFEANDKRKAAWTGPHASFFISTRYKNTGGLEYYTVMRLAEMYLIRAEATILLDPTKVTDAIADINVIRKRAGIDELDDNLSSTAVIDAIARERRVEFFLEWGHRWFDLKRTGKAHDVLSNISYKQPWWGDYQFLYPIPDTEIKTNGQLVQNPEYNSF